MKLWLRTGHYINQASFGISLLHFSVALLTVNITQRKTITRKTHVVFRIDAPHCKVLSSLEHTGQV